MKAFYVEAVRMAMMKRSPFCSPLSILLAQEFVVTPVIVVRSYPKMTQDSKIYSFLTHD